MKHILVLLVCLGVVWSFPQDAGRPGFRDALQRFRSGPPPSVSFTEYLSYTEITDYIHTLCINYPGLAKCDTVGHSAQGLPIYAIRVSTNPLQNKRKILIDAGIHAREWLAPASALFLIYQLVENQKNNGDLVEDFDWLIIPLLNPDGYEYSRNHDRLWRKNRSNTTMSNCRGVDLNRNFGIRFGGKGTSNDPCSETYRGPSAFSEPEAIALRDYAARPENGNGLLYLTIHSFGKYFLYPWGYGSDLPDDWEDLHELGQVAAEAVNSVFNTTYQVGSSTKLLGPAAGGSDDWMKGGQMFKYSYTVELPGGGRTGFEMPPSGIFNAALEVFEGIRAMVLHVDEIGTRKRRPGF